MSNKLTALEVKVVEFARKYDALGDLCDYIDYEPDIGRVPEYWKPKPMIVMLVSSMIEKGA